LFISPFKPENNYQLATLSFFWGKKWL